MSNPVLIELTRGSLVESRHAGSLAIVRPNGEVVVALGDVMQPVYPRSAVKSIQALSLIESGAADHFGFGDQQIALTCASHSGTPAHVSVAADMLQRVGLDAAALACGAHEPGDSTSARQMIRQGVAPTALDNNCSGKHSGMLATAVHLGEAPAEYWRPEHPVQTRIQRNLADMTSCELGADVRGIDGCSVPNWAIPLKNLAQAFARFATGDGLIPGRRAAAERIRKACWAAPDMVAGPGRLDTVAMTALAPKVFTKTGAEGVYCGAFPELGLGFALKVDDGARRASHAAAAVLLQRLFPTFSPPPDLLGPMHNWRGFEVGVTRAASDFERALDSLIPS